MSSTVTVATWNVQWRRTGGAAAEIIRSRLFAHQPDVICLTESHANFLAHEGHSIVCGADCGYPVVGDRRKVLLWSKQPWTDVDVFGDPSLPSGRFVAGTTQTALGSLRFLGVCIPWAAAHVSSGRRDRARWEDHLAYLTGLADVLARQTSPFVLLGDFNQAVPRRTAPRHVFSSLVASLGANCRILTAGQIEGCGHAVDHIALSDTLDGSMIQGLSAEVEGGSAVSDHFGVVARVVRTSIR